MSDVLDLWFEQGMAVRTGMVGMTVTGRLDTVAYPALRDGLLKAAVEASDAMVVTIEGMEIEQPALLRVFSLVATRISAWPGIPMALVTSDSGQRSLLLETGSVGRFVPVYRDVETAVSSLRLPLRHRVEHELPRSPVVVGEARLLIAEACRSWSVGELTEDAVLIGSELVTNTLVHTRSVAKLRLELRRGLLTVAVADDDPRVAVLHERSEPAEHGLGLIMVAQIASAWGCSRSWTGGKVVWAVLSGDARPTWAFGAG